VETAYDHFANGLRREDLRDKPMEEKMASRGSSPNAWCLGEKGEKKEKEESSNHINDGDHSPSCGEGDETKAISQRRETDDSIVSRGHRSGWRLLYLGQRKTKKRNWGEMQRHRGSLT